MFVRWNKISASLHTIHTREMTTLKFCLLIGESSEELTTFGGKNDNRGVFVSLNEPTFSR